MSKRKFLVTSALPYHGAARRACGAYCPPTPTFATCGLAARKSFICGSDDNGVPRDLRPKEGERRGVTATKPAAADSMAWASSSTSTAAAPARLRRVALQFSQGFSRPRTTRVLRQNRRPSSLRREDGHSCPTLREGHCYHRKATERPARTPRPTATSASSAATASTHADEGPSAHTGMPARPRKTTLVHATAQVRAALREWLESKRIRPTAAALARHRDQFALGQIMQGLPEGHDPRLHWACRPAGRSDARARCSTLVRRPIGLRSRSRQVVQDHEGDWKGYERWWRSPTASRHFIGEDNTVFHALTGRRCSWRRAPSNCPGRWWPTRS